MSSIIDDKIVTKSTQGTINRYRFVALVNSGTLRDGIHVVQNSTAGANVPFVSLGEITLTSPASSQDLDLALVSQTGYQVEAAGAIGIGDLIYSDATGKATSTQPSGGVAKGVAESSAAADGDIISVIPI